MPRNGSGGYTLPVGTYTSGTLADASQITSDLADIQSAIAGSVAKDGQTAMTGNLSMGSNKVTGLGNASARTDASATGQVQDGSFVWCGTAGGTKNALTLTPSPAITAYATGQKFRFKVGSTASDSTVTVAISGLATKAVEIDDTALSASLTLAANKYYEILYDGTAFQAHRLSEIPSTDLVNDTTPQLGGDLDLNGNAIDFPTTANISDVLDEDDMVSDSATALATQQSIKAYVDTNTAKGLIQAAQTTDTTDRSTSSTTLVTTTGVTATFGSAVTSGSSVLIQVQGLVGGSATGVTPEFQLYRNTGGGDAAVSGALFAAEINNNSGVVTLNLVFLDTSPGTAASSYTLYWKTDIGTAYLGRAGSSATPGSAVSPSRIIIMELAG